MMSFLKPIDNKTWKTVIKGWKHHVVATSLKSEADQSQDDNDDEALANDKTLNDIFNGVDKNMSRLINTCIKAKEACEILKITHEGTSKVHMSRMHLLTTEFEKLRMMGDESISSFNIRLRDIANNLFAFEREDVRRETDQKDPQIFASKV